MRHQFLTLAIFLREFFCDESLKACGTPEGNLNYEEISLDRSCEKGEFPWSAIVISSETRKFVTFGVLISSRSVITCKTLKVHPEFLKFINFYSW